MSMQIGDAILKFVGDTTDLDAAFQQVQEGSAAKLAPVQADVAGISTALDAVVESAQAAGAAMAEAGEQGTQAASTLSEAQTNVAKLTYENQVAQKSLQVALRQVHATSGDVASVIESLGRAQARAAQTAQALAAAQDEVRASSINMGTAAAEAGTVTTFSMHEAKAEIALLGEEVGVKVPRHLRGFLAEIPGVGAALTALFSVTAVLMLIQIVVEAGKKLYEFGMKGLEAAEKIAESWSKSTGEIRKHNDELQVANDKLDVEIAKLEHKPANMLKLALDESIVAADKLAEALAKDYDEVQKLLKQDHVSGMESFIGMFTGGSKSTSDEESLITKLAKGLKEIGVQGQINAGNAKTEDERATAAAKTRLELQEAITKAIAQTSEGIGHLNRSENLQGQFLSIKPEALEASKNMLLGYLTQLRVMQSGFNAQSANDQKVTDKAKLEQHKAANEELTKVDEAKLAADKKDSDARADLYAATAKLMRAERQISAVQELQMLNMSAEAKYNAELTYQQRMLALLQRDPTKNAAAIIAKNAEIEALEKEHMAKLAENATQTAEMLNKVQEGLDHLKPKPVNWAVLLPPPDVLKGMRDLETAYRTLGIIGPSMYHSLTIAAQSAYATVAASATKGSLIELEARRSLMQAEINEAKSHEQNTKAKEKDLATVVAAINKATDATKKYARADQSVIGLMGEMHKELVEQHGDLTKSQQQFNAIAGDMSNVFGSAVSSFVSGQETMGQALEKALAQYLANLAGKAAADALYFAAWGIADTFWFPSRAAGDFAAAGEFAALAAIAGGAAYGMSGGPSSSSSSSGSSASTPASGNGISGSSSSAGTAPTQTTNVHRFGAGALISQPTLAVIGDSIHSADQSATEAVLPLDDPKAMSAIADAITARMGPGGGGDTHVHMPNLRGIVSSDVLSDVIDQMNTQVQGGKRLLASEARRTVRRS